MTGILNTAWPRRSSLALTLIFGIQPGFSAKAASPQIERASVELAVDAAHVSLPEAPLPQQPVSPAGQTGQAPAAIPGNAPALAEGPGMAQAAASGTIQGLITDRDGVPYQGVEVTLTRTAAPFAGPPAGQVSGQPSGIRSAGPGLVPDIRAETTDGQGRFQFRSIAPGPFQLSVASDGFATQIRTGTLNAGESFEEPPISLLLVSTNSEVQVTASQHDIAQAQLKQEEQQRVFGFIPNFFVVYAPNAPPLSTRQKYHLSLRNAVDPISFLAAGFFAGIAQEDGDLKGYGQGAAGYAKRFGAAYGDDFIGGMLGSAVLPSLFKQDPRYFYKGTGSKRSRAIYAIESSFLCRGDNGKRQFNYSGILGGLAGAGISNLYYPAADRNGAGLTFQNTGIGIATGSLQNLFQEFLVRRLTPKLPDYGSSKP